MLSPRQLPAQVGRVLGMLPGYPGSVLFVTALNVVVLPHLDGELKAALAGRSLRIRVLDARLAFDFAWSGARFAACRTGAEPALTIGASAHDFLLLARRQEDPDTLFFSRRLIMEGDTDLGLRVKNALDAIELPLADLARFAPPAMLARWRQAQGGQQ